MEDKKKVVVGIQGYIHALMLGVTDITGILLFINDTDNVDYQIENQINMAINATRDLNNATMDKICTSIAENLTIEEYQTYENRKLNIGYATVSSSSKFEFERFYFTNLAYKTYTDLESLMVDIISTANEYDMYDSIKNKIPNILHNMYSLF